MREKKGVHAIPRNGHHASSSNNSNPQHHPQFRSSPTEAPRQILTTAVVMACIVLLGISPVNHTNLSSVQRAALAVYSSFLLFCFLQTRDLILTWPHPGVWRVVQGACGFYALCLVGMLVLSREDARFALHTLFPGIGTQEEFDSGLQERIDAVMGTCELSSAALYRQLFHCPWFLAHAAGWALKMLVFRDYYLAFFAAVVFEIMEVVPEFEECWWDSLFLDTLGANLIGMFLGSKLNSWIANQQIRRDEQGRELLVPEDEVQAAETELGMAFSWAGRDWKVFTSLKRMAQVSTAAFLMSLSELNSFLLINSFGIANNTSWCVLFRITVVGFIAIPAGAEWFAYIEECERRGNDSEVRLGPSLWMLGWTTLLEIAVSIKFFPLHMRSEIAKAGNATGVPYDVLVPLIVSSILTLIWVMLKYDPFQCMADAKNKRRLMKQCARWQLIDCILAASAIPIAYLFAQGWKWD